MEHPIRVIGHRWAKDTHITKDFLGRNRIPFAWLDIDHGRKATELLASLDMPGATLPLVVMSDGTVLQDPTIDELAEHLGMHTHADATYYDLAIVGGGPAGLAAAVYGASEGLSTVMIEAEAPGGQAGTSSRIENYLGFPDGISGGDLAERALAQARRLGAEVLTPLAVTAMSVKEHYKTLALSDGTELTARAVIVATGVTYRALSAPGLDRLNGAGVYYGAATTEAEAAKGEVVYTVGSANSAGQGAMYFSKFAAKVNMLVRGESLAAHMSQYLIDQIAAAPNIEVLTGTHVAEANGDTHLQSLTLETTDREQTRVPASFLFVFIGAEPRHGWLPAGVACDEHGYVFTGLDAVGEQWPLERDPLHLETSVPGVFAAGDVRHGSIRRVAGGVGEGSTCVQLVHRYLAES